MDAGFQYATVSRPLIANIYISIVLVTSVAPSPSVLFLGLSHWWGTGEGIISLPHPSASVPSAADASQSASSPSRKEEKKTG